MLIGVDPAQTNKSLEMRDKKC